MLTGINDVKVPQNNVQEVVFKADSVCRKYQEAFPNARIHLGSIAPAHEKCVQYNSYMQDLANTRQVPFISTDGMFEEGSGRVKEGLLNGIHYTKQGIRPFAKQIKRSLYSRSTLPRQQSPPIGHNSRTQHLPSNISKPTPHHTESLRSFFQMALSCLPDH